MYPFRKCKIGFNCFQLFTLVSVLGLPASIISGQEKPERRYSDAVVEQATRVLTDAGLRRSGKNILAAEQATQLRNVGAISKKSKEVQQAFQRLVELKQHQKTIDSQQIIAVRNLRSVNLRRANASDFREQQQLVAMNNALIAQIEELRATQKNLATEINTARSSAQQLESDFVDDVLNARQALNESREAIQKSLADKKVGIALEVFAAEFGTSRSLDANTIFKTLEFRIAELEKDFLREAVELIDDGSRTKKIAVSVNGNAPLEMVLDSGADIVLIPKSAADKLGITFDDDTPQMIIGVADGRTIPARLVKLDKVRVGKFEVADVEAAVLETESGQIELLLGMSFLNNFQFQINAAENTLMLTQIKDR